MIFCDGDVNGILLSRDDAARLGMKRYFTGQACTRGHVAERRVIGGHCVECRKLAARADRRRGVPETALGSKQPPSKPFGSLRPEAETLTRLDAIAAGHKRYISHFECIRGHRGERFSISGACVLCSRRGRNPAYQAKPLYLSELDVSVENAKWEEALLQTRQAARSCGSRRFFDGLFCNEGHRAPRYVGNNECVPFSAIRKSKKYHEDPQFRRKCLDSEAERAQRPEVKYARNAYMREYTKSDPFMSNPRHYKNNPVERTKVNLRSLIYGSLRKWTERKRARTEEIIGIDFEGFLAHIGRMFLEGMSWENRQKWEIDHIIPLATADSPERVVELFHFTNLRPIWKNDNRTKGARITHLI